jgi:hypothetical protein
MSVFRTWLSRRLRTAANRLDPGTRILDGRLLAARENYGELTHAAETHLARCQAASADQTATGLPFVVSEARRRLASR